jgi:hypothetical protein
MCGIMVSKLSTQIITIFALLLTLAWLFGCADDPMTGDQDINDKTGNNVEQVDIPKSEHDSAIQSIFKFGKSKLMKRITGIEGIVSNLDNKPVARIRVQIVEGAVSYPRIVVFTDKKGYYRLDGLSTGSFKVGFFNADGEKLGVKDASVKKGKITKLDFVVSDQPNEEFIIGDMQIEDVEIQFLKSLPLQINLAVKGILGDGCTTLNEITQKRDGNTVYVKITTKRPKGVACIEIAKFITENVKLDGGFPQGHYKIIVNNVVKEFDIDGGR